MRKEIAPAVGWLALGNPVEAWAVLEELPPEDRARGDVLALRVEILLALHRWEDAAVIAAGLLRLHPLDADARIYLARALCRLGRPEEARRHAEQVSILRPDLRLVMLECADLERLW